MGGFFLVSALALAGYVFVRVASGRRVDALAERERGRWRNLIAQDARNVAAHEALGDSLRAARRPAEARAAYVQALEAGGDRLRDDALRYKIGQIDLAHLERAAGPRDPDREQILCPQCGAVNPPHNRACETCAAVLPYATFREALRDKELLRATAEAAACAVVLMIALGVFSAQPLDIKGVLVISTVIVVAWRVLQAVGPRRL